MSKFFDKILSKYQRSFRKGFNSRHSLSNYVREMAGKYRQRRLFWGTLDLLSKVFDCILHDL